MKPELLKLELLKPELLKLDQWPGGVACHRWQIYPARSCEPCVNAVCQMRVPSRQCIGRWCAQSGTQYPAGLLFHGATLACRLKPQAVFKRGVNLTDGNAVHGTPLQHLFDILSTLAQTNNAQ